MSTTNLSIRSSSHDRRQQDQPSNVNGNSQVTPLSAETLLKRCRLLHAELEAFREHLKQANGGLIVEMSHYRNLVKSELGNLEKLALCEREQRKAEDGQSPDNDSADETQNGTTNQQHVLSSSNLPFLECVWDATKASTGVQALNKTFCFGPKESREDDSRRPRPQESSGCKGKAFVDVVAKNGLEWIKVSLITNHRMLMDKAREGWCADSDSESEHHSHDSVHDDDTDSGIPIVRMARSLVEAAKTIRIRTQHPTIRLAMPKVVEGQVAAVDAILSRFRSSGIQVDCGSGVIPRVSLEKVLLHNMVNDPFHDFTTTLNIDCTLLLALVSDFSHTKVTDEPWFHRALKRQIELENKENLLPCVLYPALSGHDLVCTREAAVRMREIVNTIGTSGEKMRTEIFLGSDKTSEESRAALRRLSRFDVPDDLRLPIRIMSSRDEADTVSHKLPAAAAQIHTILNPINQSVFLYGWKQGLTTVTSNRTVVKQIESVLDKSAHSENDWPRIWLCPTARSLVGKEKDRRA